MTGTHSHARAFVEQRRGVCTWRFEWEDVAITCDSPDIPGTRLCLDHLRLTETVVFECRAIITRDGR
jgi:hypothetical protein